MNFWIWIFECKSVQGHRKSREPDTLLLLTRTHTDDRGRRHSVAVSWCGDGCDDGDGDDTDNRGQWHHAMFKERVAKLESQKFTFKWRVTYFFTYFYTLNWVSQWMHFLIASLVLFQKIVKLVSHFFGPFRWIQNVYAKHNP